LSIFAACFEALLLVTVHLKLLDLFCELIPLSLLKKIQTFKETFLRQSGENEAYQDIHGLQEV